MEEGVVTFVRELLLRAKSDLFAVYTNAAYPFN